MAPNFKILKIKTKNMKKLLLLTTIVLLALSTQAKIWRVNNNPTLDGDVLQVSTLFNGTNTVADPEAANGDSIYVEPSVDNYAGFNVNKQVSIFGYGYFLAQNAGMQANAQNAFTDQVNFVTGSAGSSISGFQVNNTIFTSNVSNITITRCLMNNFGLNSYTANATGIRLDKCFISSQVFEQITSAPVTTIGFAMENCVISTAANSGVSGIVFTQKVRGLIRNCTFNNMGSLLCFNFFIANNIAVGNVNTGTISNSGNNVYRNNILSYPNNAQNAFVTNTAPNSGNLFAQNMAPVFVGNTDNTFVAGTTFNNRINVTGLDVESRFELKAVANVATAGGESGTTFGGATVTTPACGAFGATDPYRKGGFPNIPRITALTVPASVSNGAANMTISVSSSSNN